MYYFNCEHPAGILYRDKRAEFLESNPAYKIGADLEGNNYKIPILEFQLEQGDVIILGSDGRDDLSVVDERGQRKINEDETHILKIVEKSNASLEQIYKELQKVGEFIDDISLIKISYLGNNFENKDKELDLDHIKNLIQKLKFRKALEELENTEDDSSSSEYIYYKALCMERLGLGTGAISLLDKKHQIIKNHIPSQHLKAYIFYRAGEFEKSKVVLDYCFENNKDSKQTKALIQKVFEKLKSMD
jgi:tetratricopeptide (TPR) repeat protein